MCPGSMLAASSAGQAANPDCAAKRQLGGEGGGGGHL